MELLRPMAKGLGRFSNRVAFRALAEYDVRQADVSYLVAERYLKIDRDDFLRGAPELLIEVLSPSKTADELEEKCDLCLENGGLEFWVVRPRASTVTVYTLDGRRLYKSGDAVPVDRFFPGCSPIPVDEIFAPPEI